MLFEVYPDAKLNMRALYTFTISSLMDVSTTWGAQTTRYHVGSYFTTSSFPDVPSLMSPASSPPAASTLEQWLPRLPGLHHHQRHHLPGSRCEEGTRGGGSRGHGEERGHEGQAGVRNYEEFLVLLYSTWKLSTATNQF